MAKAWTHPEQKMIYTWALVCPNCRKECHFNGMGDQCAYWQCKCGIWEQAWRGGKEIISWKLDKREK